MDALGDPTRRAVLRRLRGGARSVGEIAAGMDVSRPAVSQHLKILKAARLVTDRASRARGRHGDEAMTEQGKTGSRDAAEVWKPASSDAPIKVFQFPRMFGIPEPQPVLQQAGDLASYRGNSLRGRRHARSSEGAQGKAAVHRGPRRPDRRYVGHRGSPREDAGCGSGRPPRFGAACDRAPRPAHDRGTLFLRPGPTPICCGKRGCATRVPGSMLCRRSSGRGSLVRCADRARKFARGEGRPDEECAVCREDRRLNQEWQSRKEPGMTEQTRSADADPNSVRKVVNVQAPPEVAWRCSRKRWAPGGRSVATRSARSMRWMPWSSHAWEVGGTSG
jgi:DNA-binding transcriptional ArsR family regulator